jgi:hypothetical protein
VEQNLVEWAALEVPGNEIAAVAVDAETPWADLTSLEAMGHDFWLHEGIRLGASLVALGAPTDLAAECFAPTPSRGFISRLSAFIASLQAQAEDAEVVSSVLVWSPIPSLVVGAGAGARISGRLSVAAGSGSSWKLTIAGLGVTRERTYESSVQLEARASNGEGTRVDLLIPLLQTVRRVVPAGGSEAFPVAFYEHVGDVGPARLGSRATTTGLSEILASTMPDFSVPMGGDTPYTDTREHKTERRRSVSIALPGERVLHSASATFETSMSVSTTVHLPSGRFELSWLNTPAGAVVDSWRRR